MSSFFPKQFKDQEAYDAALRKARVTVPEQEPVDFENNEHRDWWACGCKLPWWAFRRGTHHFYVMPDGQHYAYEQCPKTCERKRAAAMRKRSEEITPKRGRL